MQFVEAIILGLLQGITEFIPVSSSGHLILADNLFGFEVGNHLFDVMLHIGTLLAILIYFRNDIKALIIGTLTGSSKLGWYIILATIPAVVVGYFIEGLAEDSFRSSLLVAINLVVVALFMLWFDKKTTTRSIDSIRLPEALIVGVAQSLALIPGVSRSGITIVSGVAQGLSREAAARFAFLLGIPAFVGASAKVLLDGGVGEIGSNMGVFLLGMFVAALSGYFAIRFMLSFLANRGLAVFAYYRILLAVVIMGTLLIN